MRNDYLACYCMLLVCKPVEACHLNIQKRNESCAHIEWLIWLYYIEFLWTNSSKETKRKKYVDVSSQICVTDVNYVNLKHFCSMHAGYCPLLWHWEFVYSRFAYRKRTSNTTILHPDRGIVSKQHEDRGRDGKIDKEIEGGMTHCWNLQTGLSRWLLVNLTSSLKLGAPSANEWLKTNTRHYMTKNTNSQNLLMIRQQQWF